MAVSKRKMSTRFAGIVAILQQNTRIGQRGFRLLCFGVLLYCYEKNTFVITKSEIGGAQKYVLDLAQGAKENGFAVGGSPASTTAISMKRLPRRASFHEIKSVQRAINVWQDIQLFFELLAYPQRKAGCCHLNSSKMGGNRRYRGKIARQKLFLPPMGGRSMSIDRRWKTGDRACFKIRRIVSRRYHLRF